MLLNQEQIKRVEIKILNVIQKKSNGKYFM